MNAILEAYLKNIKLPTKEERFVEAVKRAMGYAREMGHQEFYFDGEWYQVKFTPSETNDA
jgi:hypothetical protein